MRATFKKRCLPDSRLPHGRCICGHPADLRAHLRLCRSCAPEVLAGVIAIWLGDDPARLEEWFADVRRRAVHITERS
jgi:hypothetical protein